MSVLRQARTDRGWSQGRAIAELQRQAQALGVSIPAPSSLKTQLSRWENGHRTPDAFYQQLLGLVYGRDPVQLGIAQADDTLISNFGHSWEESVHSAADMWKQDLGRRDFLKSAAFVATGFAAPSLHALVGGNVELPHRAAGAVSVTASHVSAIQGMTSNLASLDNRHGAGQIRHTAVAFLDGEVAPLLKSGQFSAQVGRSLLGSAAELARLVGWMTHDTGRHGLAQRYLIQALRLAEAAGERALMAETLAAMSQQATYMNEARDGVDLARGARTLAEREGLSALVAETLVMEAHGHARSGDAASCATALSAAENTLDRADRSSDPHWIGYFDEAYLSAKFGHCFLELGDSARAVGFARRSLQMNEGYTRGQVFNLTLLAHAHAQAGEVEESCAVGEHAAAAAAEVQSTRVSHHLRNFRRTLAPAEDTIAVSKLDQSLRPLLSAA